MTRKMKDSGIAWIGEIPDGWEVVPNKYLMSKIKYIKNIYENEDILSLTMNGVIKRDLEAGGKMPTSFDGYQILYKGNLLMCLFDYDVTPRTVGRIGYNGLTSPAYSQYKLYECANQGYYYYYYLMLDYTKELLHLSKNLRSSFSEYEFGNIKAPKPPIIEQEKIADFLDDSINKINDIKNKIKQEIQKLEAYKQALITEAVTKGLDKDAPMKDSGIEWIGEIPEHWNISKIKRYCNIQTGSTPSTANKDWFDGELNWFTPGDFSNKYILNDSKRKLSEKAKYDGIATIIKPNSVMIICIGATIGKVGFTLCESSCNQQITSVYSNIINNKYLMYWFIANSSVIRETAQYTTLPIINNTVIGNYDLIFPNDITEQTQIVSYLDKKCSSIDRALDLKRRQVNVLEDYKKSLIYKYVTGKKEVVG